MESEGLYRVAGFHDDVEAIKMTFDKGNIGFITFFSTFLSAQFVLLCGSYYRM